MRAALLSVPGVRTAEVSFSDQEAVVEYDRSQASVPDLVAAIEGLGFQAWDSSTEKPARDGPGDGP